MKKVAVFFLFLTSLFGYSQTPVQSFMAPCWVTSTSAKFTRMIPANTIVYYGTSQYYLAKVDLGVSNTLAGCISSGKVTALPFQPMLVNRVNIKTINGNSVLGSGNLTISGGGITEKMLNDTVYAYKRPYKVYTALLTQEGTNAPVAITLENNIGLIISYYNDIGYYYVTIPYTTGNVFVLIGLNTSVTTRITSEYQADGETIAIYSRNNGTLSNGLMYNIPIEIRVYQ